MLDIQDQLDAIAGYLEWNRKLPFGAPNDLEAYGRHLETERALANAEA